MYQKWCCLFPEKAYLVLKIYENENIRVKILPIMSNCAAKFSFQIFGKDLYCLQGKEGGCGKYGGEAACANERK